MNSLTRRSFLGRTALAAAGGSLLAGLEAADAPARRAGPRVGACVVGLAQAREAGLDGVEVRVGDAADRLEIADPKVRQRYKDQMKETGIPICSLMMGLLNSYPLATDPRAPAWLEQSIDAARDLGARVILVAFFAKGDLLDDAGKLKEADLDAAIRHLKAAAPRAKDAGVVLGVENYLRGADNARLLERVDHESVQLYYDVFNTGATKGYDVPAELRYFKSRIAQVHFKNGPDYLENGQVKFPPIVAALKEIRFKGWIVLETSSPSKDAVVDARRNAEYVRRLFA